MPSSLTTELVFCALSCALSRTLLRVLAAVSCFGFSLYPQAAFSQTSSQNSSVRSSSYYLIDSQKPDDLIKRLDNSLQSGPMVRIHLKIEGLRKHPETNPSPPLSPETATYQTAMESPPPKTRYSSYVILQKTLRAHKKQPNHFIVDSYHIVTTPLSWNRHHQTYRIRLSLSKRLGYQGNVEKHLGHFDVTGKLEPQILRAQSPKQNLFLLISSTQKMFYDDAQQPTIKVIVGISPKSPLKVTQNYQNNVLPRGTYAPPHHLTKTKIGTNRQPMNSSEIRRKTAPPKAQAPKEKTTASKKKKPSTPLVFDLGE